ncbi:MAG: response regulator [Anaerolineae bacterium]
MELYEQFAQGVRDVIEHLYDYPNLQTHTLADQLWPGEDLAPRERARLLRKVILDTIEALNPGPDVSSRSLQARPYHVLNLHYVAGMTVEAVANELGISDRQLYRDLRKAEQDLIDLLWTDQGQMNGQNGARHALHANLVLREAEILGAGVEEVSVRMLLEGALDAVSQLMRQFEVGVVADLPHDPLHAYTDRLLARQALVNALSHAVQTAQPGATVHLSACAQKGKVQVALRFKRNVCADSTLDEPTTAGQLVRRLGGHWAYDVTSDGSVHILLTLGDRNMVNVLVIDDNENLHELFRRYLEEDYRLSIAHNGRVGVRLAEETLPDVIVLDVMMPQEDGWEVLQTLRHRERTRHIPVIVCSVVNDPQLAFSLGACEFVAKPVNRTRLLEALAHCRLGSRAS